MFVGYKKNIQFKVYNSKINKILIIKKTYMYRIKIYIKKNDQINDLKNV